MGMSIQSVEQIALPQILFGGGGGDNSRAEIFEEMQYSQKG